MDHVELYSFLFADNLMGTLALPPHTAYVLRAMLGFGGYPPAQMLIFSSLGVVVGTLLNWLLGRMLITCRDKEWVIVDTPRLDKLRGFFRKYLAWSMAFTWVPGLGAVISLFAGFCKVRFWPALLFAGIGTTAYYAVLIW